MDFLISDALAQTAPPAPQEPGLAGLILPLAILAIFFFLFVLPQQRRAKEHKKMVQSLTKGSEVVTTGGLLGRVVDLDDNFVQLELAENVCVHVQRHAIASLLPKGTYKAKKQEEQRKTPR
ncbi:preprotein translocase subunit YajC [Candidatus Methylocalor cossyra]|uniref:Sec translocon accessory complex subunit YajC n=1 Tax=Candidatus Methylocalor cossyra TaxID=3108543 RepID=A0ABM9NKK5_9GAMM